MIAMNHRLVNTVVNRCQMPTDGDILVPIRTVSVIGTTDENTDDPDDHTVRQSEVDAMLDDGEKLVPGFRQARALRVWTGVRPLFEDAKTGAKGKGAEDPEVSSRDVTRSHALLDHLERDGVKRFLTITGGKLTTYRLMAEHTVDTACAQLGHPRPCPTRTAPLPGSRPRAYYHLGERLAVKEEKLRDEQMVCECELVSRGALETAIRSRATTHLDDLRRLLRLGMGPCQGGFCMYRATGIMHALDGIGAPEADRALVDFLQERWKGVWPILYGDQLRQVRLDDWIFQGVLDVEHLPC
jgi:glycerol-3-phosphate dehydrogenase